MKASILSLIGIENYGSLLQVFATVKKFEEYADKVEIINCIQHERIVDVIKAKKNPIKALNFLVSYLFFKRNYVKFKNEHLSISKNAYRTYNDFKKYICDSDIYCVGSDQIWNPDLAANMPFNVRFLCFIPDNKRKFAYASSFGKDIIEEIYINKSKEFISQFEKISVREDSGLTILKEQYKYKNAIQLVDPTLAFSSNFWRKYSTVSKIKGEYILIYGIARNKELDCYANKLSKKTGLPLVRLCHSFHQIRLCGKAILIPPIFDFITLIDNAKYVITNSFHGAAFSMNLNTEPICVYQTTSGRISSFLRLVAAEHRAIKDYNDFDIINRPTDFDHVNKVLARERERVDEFLKSIFVEQGSHYG